MRDVIQPKARLHEYGVGPEADGRNGPPIKNPESVMTGTPSLWKVLDMRLGGTAEIDDAAAQKRN